MNSSRTPLSHSWLLTRSKFLLFMLALVASVTVARATTVIPPSFEQLVDQADYIVRAKVTSVTAEWRTDANGQHIMTKVALDVTEVIAGTPPQPLVLEMLGGKIGNQEMRIEGAPQFHVGDEDILFVHGNGKMITPLVAMMHGRYPVLRDDAGQEYIARENRAPLYSEQDVSTPMNEGSSAAKAEQSSARPLSPTEFISRIKATRTRNTANVHAN